jgi:hypothetical protein
VLAATLDPDGRRVVLTEERWAHIKDDHPELARFQREIMETVREPTRRLAGREVGEEWFYLAEEGPSLWLKVVVHYEGEEGRIQTAFARSSMP